jgi:diaminopimelate decarboxylase
MTQINSNARPIPFGLLPDSAEIGSLGELLIGGLAVDDLAAEFGTPLFIYDESHLRARCREALEAFGEGAAYACKAFLCLAMARLVHEEGLHLDVASEGELHTAIAAGVPGERIVLHGNNKSLDELSLARSHRVSRVVVDSFDELDRLRDLHSHDGVVAPVLLRVTPGVEAHTHEFVSTGQNDSKFGFGLTSGAASAAVGLARSNPGIDLVGIHSHIGSQVFNVESFARALEIVVGFSEPLELPELSVGGGLGVAYLESESAPSIAQWGETLSDTCQRLGVKARISAEPGRSISAQAAITVYSVGTVKELPGIRTYVAVDGGFGDNPRPMLYDSGYTAFVPDRVAEPRPAVARIVGKHCESGDVLVREASLPDGVGVGDLIATPVTGAYGYSMGSTYNRIPRPAVVFVSNGSARPVVRRETLEDLIRLDVE